MIQYNKTISPSYNFNKAYCERIGEVATARNAFCMGFCNSSGYEVYYSFTENSIHYVVEFLKHKTFQNGFITTPGGNDYYGFSMRAITPIKGTEFHYGKSLLKRFFTKNEFKERIPAGQFVFVKSQLGDQAVRRIVDELAGLSTDSASLKNGVLDICRHQSMIDPGWALDDLMQRVNQFILLTSKGPQY